MANEKNLIPLNKRSKKEQREISKKGGKASGETRRKQKTYRELAKVLLSAKVDDEEMKSMAAQFGIKNIDVKTLTHLGMIRAAAGGSHNAFDRLLALVGEDVEKNEESKKQSELLNAIEKAVRDAD